ncbi:FG-GAP repeat domain-containing protein [Streptomyces sp. NPDC093089]|uniref:FG-GAP repeat domain-containing protein n=1 Tax=Streptomyces sp. NPDC093089 TaxID=3366024 RepID=UPI0037FD2A57
MLEAAREARRTGKDVEVTAERTAHATTWAQPDGQFRTRTHSDTIRAKVGGEWKKIDTTLRRTKEGYAPAAVNDALLFSAGTAAKDFGGRASRAVQRTVLPQAASLTTDAPAWSELVRLTVDGHDLVVSWPGQLPAPVVDGARALYQDVRPGIDLLLTARDSGYSHVLIVHTRQAAQDPLLADLNYRLSSPTLTFRLDPVSHVVSAVDGNGTEMAAAPTPYLWDSAGEIRTTLGEPVPAVDPSLADTALALPSLAGPQPGSHDAALGATLSADGVLQLAVKPRVLDDPDVVYPVFIDPSFKGRKKNWTLLYEKYPSSSFYNGQNFNDGTNEARVGFEATTQGISRSVFNFEHDSKLNDAVVTQSTFRIWQTYSWGCTPTQYNVYLAGTVSPAHSWNSPPTWGRLIKPATSGSGYRADTCPDSWVGVDMKSIAQEASTGHWAGIGIGLRAANEADTSQWKKFMANGELSPYIETVYNHNPNEPLQVGMSTVPGGTCDTASPYLAIGKSDITFQVTGVDKDGDLRFVHLKVWPNDNPGAPVIDKDISPTSDGYIKERIDWERFTGGKTYSWSAWTIDYTGGKSAAGPSGTTAYCQFTVDHTAPGSPLVTSADFPVPGPGLDQWSLVEFGTAGKFTFSTAITVAGETKPDPGVTRYEYSINIANPTANPYLTTTGGAAVTKTLTPPMAGPNILCVWAVDSAGNRSAAPAKYVFYVKPRKAPDPAGDLSGDGTPDLLAIDAQGNLRTYAAETAGDVGIDLPAGLDANGKLLDDGYWKNPTTSKPALITHSGDWYPGDGVNDMLARMPDGKLYLYPGDGYGSFNTAERLDILLPANAPNPATLTQITATGDITGDGLPDMFALAGTQLWAFTGYTGAAFTDARQLATTGWNTQDIVTVADISGDNVPDLLFRTEETGRGLLLRHGKPATTGGVDLTSLTTPAASATGKDEVYGSGGWNRASIPMIIGIPDANGDTIPDLWAVMSNASIRFYPGNRTGHGTSTEVGAGGWTGLLTLG